VRVTDSSSPPNAVAGATVAFLTTVLRPAENSSPGNPVVPVILSVNQNDVESDVNGLASLQPSAGTLGPPLEVVVGAAAGNASLQYELQVLDRLPPLNGNAPPRRVSPPVTIPPPRRELRMIWPADVTD
jgi:hypothetical protein